MNSKKLWIFPLLFGIIGTFIGLLLRYAFTGAISTFPFKNVLHAHSHVMLLGFLFNALLILVWINFIRTIDKISFWYYVAMQVCMALMIVAFILQGYAFYSILFSTLYLWISYILLIRLWKRLEGENFILLLVKSGIVFYFLSSLGPYTLGPLMVLDKRDTPWFQQAIFFYLHFQFLGVYFTWLLALLFEKAKLTISKKQVIAIILSLIFLYAHSLEYSFDHWLIQFFGGLGSLLLFAVLLMFWSSFINLNKSLKNIYYLTLIVAVINIVGTFPYIAEHIVNNRFVLIAWLHLLFLGLYVPFIWVLFKKRIHSLLWILYGFTVFLSEFFLVFPGLFSKWFSVSIMDLLFLSYLGLFISLSIIHVIFLFNSKAADNQDFI